MMMINYSFYIVLVKHKNLRMTLGVTIAVFVLAAVILMCLFCILTKYFSYRLRQQRRTVVQIASFDCSIQNISHELIEGAYLQFKENRQKHKRQEAKEDLLVQSDISQKAQIKHILDISNNIYGISALRQRLNSDTLPLQSQTHRSMISLKQFNITRLNTISPRRERKIYNYIKKLISYDQTGLNIIEITAQFIKKRSAEYELIKRIDHSKVLDSSNDFIDQLDSHGFCMGEYGYYQFTHSINVTDIKDGEVRCIGTLQSDISKQIINQQQFQLQKTKILNIK